MIKTVLVVAAHPDDEVLGCGATLARHCAEGARVDALIMTDGIGAREPANHVSEVTLRKAAARRACDELGIQKLTLLAYPDNRMDEIALLDIVRDIERIVLELRPEVIYTHSASDVNIDHRRVHDAVVSACRPLPGDCVQRLLFFETPSSTAWRPPSSLPPFAPNWFVDISDFMPQKLAALEAYAPEMRAFPHPRSMEAVTHLAAWRGSMIGVKAAEAFELGRARI